MVVLLWLESRLSGESRSSGTSATDRPEGERDADERGQGDGGKIARDDRGRAEADGDLPEVEQGVGDQPQSRGGPEADAAPRPQHGGEIGRASWRGRGCEYVEISGVAVSLKNKNSQMQRKKIEQSK